MELDKVNIFDYQAPSPKDILAAGPGAIAAPLSPAELMEIEKSQLSSDPVIRKLQKVGRGIGSLFAVETPLDYALSGLGAVKPVVAAGKGIAAVAKEADPKDLVFVHNTSEEAIKSFDNMGGIPSPSIAVTKGDQPFTGFGNIQLIGKPEKFDPLVDPRNKIYSADAYTPRAPQKIRLAKKGAAEKFKKDYKDFDQFFEKPGGAPSSARTVSYAFDKLKEVEEGGVGASRAYNTISDYFFSPLNAPEFVQKKYLKEIGQDEITSTSKFRKWLKKEKDKYFSQDGFFEYYDKFDGMQRKPYTLKNVVDNMVEETQRGGESGDLVASNRLRAIMAEQFKDLPDIKARKEMLVQKGLPFDFEQPIISALGKISDEAMDYSDDVISEVAMHLQAGLPVEQAVDKAFKTGYISQVDDIVKSPKKEEVIQDIATTLRLNAMRPVEYFEAKPTRAVGFDEFAGAIVPEATSQEVIDILEKRGLKVIKQKFDDIDKDYGKGKIRQQFKDQFFSAAPIAAAASATAMIDSQDQGIGSL